MNSRKRLGKVTAVTIRPTTERHSCLLRGRLVTRYFPRGYHCYFLLLGCDAKIYNPMAMTAAIKPRPRGQMGLIWLLHSRPVIALTENEATILAPIGANLTYGRHNKPAPGLIGDSTSDGGVEP
jgi:hypothetical protein